jgi:tight adherence protein B
MNVVLVAVGIVVLLAAQGAYYAILWRGHRRREALRARLRSLATPEGAGLVRDQRLARSPRVASFLRGLGFPVRLEKYLLQTDLETTVAGILLAGLALASAITLVLAVVTGRVLAAWLVGVPIGVVAPFAYVLAVRARRSRRLSLQLPEALDMMARSLRAGHGVASGLELVATEMPPPIAVEFGRCFEELQLGSSFRDAVRELPARAPTNFDLRIFATSLIIQHDTGGNLVEILDNIASTVRERIKFHGKLRAITTETRLSGYVLGALPFVCAVAIALFNPEYLRPLYTDSIGRAIVVIGLGLWALGGYWMRRLSQVDY